jgi:hypothetical protein
VVIKNQNSHNSGLIYGNETVNDLLTRDTDEDGVPDWEETLYGTDPTKIDTVPGVPDSTTIANKQGAYNGSNLAISGNALGSQNLNETDKLSRELFSTIAALNQTGVVDQNTIDNLSDSMVSEIQSADTTAKVYSYTDLKISNDNSKVAIQNYNNALNKIFQKYISQPSDYDLLAYSLVSGSAGPIQSFLDNGDATELKALDPVAQELLTEIKGLLATSVPSGLSQLHLNLINGMEKVYENINNLELVDTDTVVAMNAVDQYTDNMDSLQSYIDKIRSTIDQDLK